MATSRSTAGKAGSPKPPPDKFKPGKSKPATGKSRTLKSPKPTAARDEPGDRSQRAKPGGLPRAVWTGQLRLALVAVDVDLYPATKPGARITFHQVDRKTGKRIHYDKVAQGVGSVPRDRIAKAIEISRGDYVLMDDAELDEIKRAERHIINLVQFVGASEIDPIWFDRPYYVAPSGDIAEDAYAILRAALHKTKRIGLGQFVMRGRDYIAAIKPCGRGLLLETLHFSDEIRKAAPFFTDVPDDKLDSELLDLAAELIERKAAPFDPKSFVDRYTEDLRALVAEKVRTHKPIHVAEEKSDSGAQVINLIDALRRSVQGGRETARSRS